MGVDGINGPGGGAPPTGPNDVEGAAEGRSADRAPFNRDAGVTATSQSGETELQRVSSGELSVEDYLDARVQAATAHLNGVLGADKLAQVQEELRDRLSTDPLLARLVQRALGVSPSEPSR